MPPPLLLSLSSHFHLITPLLFLFSSSRSEFVRGRAEGKDGVEGSLGGRERGERARERGQEEEKEEGLLRLARAEEDRKKKSETGIEW